VISNLPGLDVVLTAEFGSEAGELARVAPPRPTPQQLYFAAPALVQ
jgi:hypothetical protein